MIEFKNNLNEYFNEKHMLNEINPNLDLEFLKKRCIMNIDEERVNVLIQFNFSNYRSFKNQVSLDMTAGKMTEHYDNVVEIAGDKLLKVAAIYGNNASGKTNIYNAFEDMREYVNASFSFGGDDDKVKSQEYLKMKPFIFDEKASKNPITFEVFFTNPKNKKEKIYQYGFSILENEVIEEWLFYKVKSSVKYKTIFYRKKGEITDYSGIKKGADNIELSIEKETLILSLGAKLKIKQLKEIRDWFLTNTCISFGNPVENYFLSTIVPPNFLTDKTLQKNVVEYLASFDNSIKEFEVDESNVEDEKGNKTIKIRSLHKSIGKDALIPLNFKEESSGTLKMFSLYAILRDVFTEGGVLFVDELNGKLHPLLLRSIIIAFENKKVNINNAQLIFTTHDIWQLANDINRRDEIWFVEKSEQGVSDLYSLGDFRDENGDKIRKDEDYVKNYLLGKYGAIPKLNILNPLNIDLSDATGEE